uniref:MARVEL domain-containing protein n=1 Tax=Trichobilharzia regenti TaxID=157069 RepID=A0AA85IUQ1_TRIRE|nr:unnamed protein product [Trichobilharzia regenti]
MSFNIEYARELRAIFKILEICMGLALIVSIAVVGHYRITPVGGWLLFVTTVTTATSIFFFFLHLSGLISKCSGPITLIELICIFVCFTLDLVAMIVTAATTHESGAAIASAILFAVGFVFYGIDAFILFSYYRQNGGYVNDPKTKQRPNVMPKTNQTIPTIMISAADTTSTELTPTTTTTTMSMNATATPNPTSAYSNNAFEKE